MIMDNDSSTPCFRASILRQSGLLRVSLKLPGHLQMVGLARRGIAGFSGLLLYATLLAWPGRVQADCYPAPSGLVSWWAAEGNGSDNTGRNPATLQNVTFGAGEVGQAFVLNGSNGYLQVPASASLNVGLSNGFSLETWINPATLDLRPIFEWNQTTNGWAGVGAQLWLSYNGSGELHANLRDTGGSDHIMGTTNGVITNQILLLDPRNNRLTAPGYYGLYSSAPAAGTNRLNLSRRGLFK